MASQRIRNGRGPSRNGGQGEELQLWQQSRDEIRGIVDAINADTENTRQIINQDSFMSHNESDVNREQEERKQEELFRKGVRSSEAISENIKRTIESLQVLRAIQKSKEEEAESKTGLAAPSRSGTLATGSSRNASRAGTREKERDKERDKDRDKDRERERERDKDPYEFDGAGESPVPSPIGGHTRKLGGSSGGPASDRSGNRDSVPPRGGDRDTPAKADSAEPQFPGFGNASAAQRSKVTFSKGQDVAFKPKAAGTSEASEWFLGKVQQVLGEGKARRYKVKDEDPDIPPEQRQEYRTSASNMIALPPPGQELPELEKGKTVLALYPDSTTFYKAEVMGADKETGKVNLRFEGEENSGTLQVVERRFVVEYRN